MFSRLHLHVCHVLFTYAVISSLFCVVASSPDPLVFINEGSYLSGDYPVTKLPARGRPALVVKSSRSNKHKYLYQQRKPRYREDDTWGMNVPPSYFSSTTHQPASTSQTSSQSLYEAKAANSTIFTRDGLPVIDLSGGVHNIKCPRANGRFPVLRQCGKYLECSYNIGYLRSCPMGTLYNYHTTNCDFPYRVECTDDFNLHGDNMAKPPTVRETMLPPLAPSIMDRPTAEINIDGSVSTDCPVPSGQLAIPDRCGEFLNCWSWRGTVQQCPTGTLFNCQTEKCDFPAKVRCVKNENPLAAMADLDRLHWRDFSATGAGDGEGEGAENQWSTRPDSTMEARARFSHVMAPPSGQRLRLRDGGKNSYGHVQLYHEGRWNYVCERHLTERMKNLICQDLGFSRGFQEITANDERNGLFRRDNSLRPIALGCAGNESHIHECNKSARSMCKIIVARCVENSFSQCPPGFRLFASGCYSLRVTALSHLAAKQQCEAEQATLLDIDTQEESDFVSEMLQYSPDLNLLHTAGVGVPLFGKALWLWETSTEPIHFQKWWPGWDRRSEGVAPQIGNQTVCLVLQSTYPLPPISGRSVRLDNFTMVDSGYFWWTASSCDSQLPFICQAPPLDIGCFRGHGADYTGSASVTQLGQPCLTWTSAQLTSITSRLTLDTSLIGDHNHCRNPDNDNRPWCFVNANNFDFCDVPRCNGQQSGLAGDISAPGASANSAPLEATSSVSTSSVSTSYAGPSVVSANSTHCSEGKFRCGDGYCIFFSWVCDGTPDCANHKDESGCHVHINDYRLTPAVKLIGYNVEKWLYTSREMCAKHCSVTKDFVCRAFNYFSDNEECYLLDSNVALSGALVSDPLYQFYELKSEIPDCSDSFVCANGKCIDKNQLCDGRRDCGDNEDELECQQLVDFQLRLADGASEREGRLEVRAFGRWGVVCDDEFTMVDAGVVCRQLGFVSGATEVVTNSGFGSGNGLFVMDDLACDGHEDSVTQCDFAGWFNTDCTDAEVVGVRCRATSDSCGATEWQCDNGACVSVSYVCDRVDDCGDFSDEADRLCKAEIAVRLAGGTNTSGRVEIRYKGIWGTVCDDNFDVEDAQVVCRELGLPGSAVVHQGSTFGPGAGHIWLDQVNCVGFESNLYKCSHLEWGQSNCAHEEDVGVSCQTSITNSFIAATDSESMQTVSRTVLPSRCGKRFTPDKPFIPLDQNAKLVKGQITEPGAHPWMVGVRIKAGPETYHWCGAVVISEFHILSAAHCLLDYAQEIYVLRVGDYDNQVKDTEEQEFTVDKLYPHPDFNSGSYLNNDIIVIRVKATEDGRGIKFGSQVQPVCLTPADLEYAPGRNCTICGWGSTGRNAGYARRMQSAVLPLLPISTCKSQQVYGPEKITRGMYCAGYLEGGIDTCQGDSGGPMVCEHEGANILYGITSWGQGCARPNKPGVYTKITHYLSWIYSVLQQDSIPTTAA